MAGAAIHFIRDGYNDICTGQDGIGGGISGADAEQRIRVLAMLIVVGGDRNPSGLEPVHASVPGHGLGRVCRARHGVSCQTGIHGDIGSEVFRDVVIEVRFASGGGVDGPIGIGDGLVSDDDVGRGRILHQLSLRVHHLRVDRVERWQDGEDAVVIVHAVHAEVVPRRDRPLASTRSQRCRGGEKRCDEEEVRFHEDGGWLNQSWASGLTVMLLPSSVCPVSCSSSIFARRAPTWESRTALTESTYCFCSSV